MRSNFRRPVRWTCHHVLVSTAPAEVDKPESGEDVRPDRPWITLVWNDPVNLMSYVTFVLQEYFGYAQGQGDRTHAAGAQRRASRGR